MPKLFLIITLVFLSATIIARSGKFEVTSEYELAQDVVWASPGGMDLTMDIYTPSTGRESYPVIIIFHGGGWLINNKSIMSDASDYLAKNSEYVVCNVNYRLMGDLDNSVRINEIIEDAMGAVLWVKANISKYRGDAKKIILTGDSAGGHLATCVTLMGENLSSKGFDGAPHGFRPTWLPEGKSPEDITDENGLEVQAAMISYGAFDMLATAKSGFGKPSNFFWTIAGKKARGMFGDDINYTDNPEYYEKVSPVYNIPSADKKTLPPMLFTVGEKDNLTTPASIRAFISKLESAGHTDTEFWIHEGRPHAFLDSGKNDFLGISFEKDAPPALDVMIQFLNRHFYPAE